MYLGYPYLGLGLSQDKKLLIEQGKALIPINFIPVPLCAVVMGSSKTDSQPVIDNRSTKNIATQLTIP